MTAKLKVNESSGKSVYCFCDGVHDGVYFVPVANTISV